MGMVAILFNGTDPFEQNVDTPLTKGPWAPMYKLVKTGQAVSQKKMFKDYTILYMYIAQEQSQTTPRRQNVNCN